MLWISIILMVLSGLLLLANWLGLLAHYAHRVRNPDSTRGYSFVPVIGGVLGCVGILLLPFRGAWIWCWIPLVLDPIALGSLIVFIQLSLKKRGRD
jgi:hypothetical protein